MMRFLHRHPDREQKNSFNITASSSFQQQLQPDTLLPYACVRWTLCIWHVHELWWILQNFSSRFTCNQLISILCLWFPSLAFIWYFIFSKYFNYSPIVIIIIVQQFIEYLTLLQVFYIFAQSTIIEVLPCSLCTFLGTGDTSVNEINKIFGLLEITIY